MAGISAEVEGVVAYLHGEGWERREREQPGWRPLPFVTISRQAGAGGRSLAEAFLAAAAARGGEFWSGWRVFDRELCENVARDLNIQIALNSLIREEFRNALEDVIFQIVSREASQTHIYGRLFKLILGLASVGKALVVGRGGACLTRRFPQGVHVRLIAPREYRIESVARRLGMSPAESARWVDEQDAHRAKLVKVYFQEDIDDPMGYDAVYNTERASFDSLAASLAALVEHKARRLQSLPD